VDDAYTASNEANQTAKNAKQSYIKAKNVQITQSDAVKVDIASLKAIKKIVFLLLTGTHQPTASPTLSPTRSPTVSPTLSPTTTSQVVALQAGCPQSISYQFVNGKCYTKALTTSDFVNPGTGTKNCGPIESYCQQQGGSLADKTDTHTWLNNGNEGNIQGRPHGVTSTRDSANHHWLTDGLSDFGWSDGLCDHPNRFFICVAPVGSPTTSQAVALQAGCPQSISDQFINGTCYTKVLDTKDFVDPGTGPKNCGPIESYCQQQGGSLADKTDAHTWLNIGNNRDRKNGVRDWIVTSTRNSLDHYWLVAGAIVDEDERFVNGECDHPNRSFLCVAPVTSPTTS